MPILKNQKKVYLLRLACKMYGQNFHRVIEQGTTESCPGDPEEVDWPILRITVRGADEDDSIVFSFSESEWEPTSEDYE